MKIRQLTNEEAKIAIRFKLPLYVVEDVEAFMRSYRPGITDARGGGLLRYYPNVIDWVDEPGFPVWDKNGIAYSFFVEDSDDL